MIRSKSIYSLESTPDIYDYSSLLYMAYARYGKYRSIPTKRYGI